MSYIVTARKWRPQLFSDVISQKHVTETLKNAISGERVGHAYLFSGPRGVGKTTVARIFAKALNCEKGPAAEPCNECENCVNIQSGSSMDIQELDGASNNSVEDVRNLISNVGYHASHCRYKMYIIDEVHMLSVAAFNALLKTLEEPPPNVIFIFATTEPHKIPVTILSRCQRFDFHRLSIHDIAGKIRKIASADGIDIDDGSVMLIAQRAGGAMRDAESILEQLKSTRGGSITVQDINVVLGIADRMVFFDVIERCRENDAFGAISLFRSFYDEGGDLKEFVEGLLGHMRDLLYARYDHGIEHIMLDEEMKARVVEQSGWFEHGDLIRMISVVTDIETSLAYAVLPVLRIEVALARLASMERTVQLKDLFERLGGEQAVERIAPAEASPRKASAPASVQARSSASEAPQPVTRDELEMQAPPVSDEPEKPAVKAMDFATLAASWTSIVRNVMETRPIVATTLGQVEPRALEDGKLVLGVDAAHSFHRKAIESGAAEITEILEPLIGLRVRIVCEEFVRETPPGTNGGTEKKNNELDDLIAREPVIRDILDRFDGDIIDTWRDKNG